jgi:hypothetical protein
MTAALEEVSMRSHQIVLGSLAFLLASAAWGAVVQEARLVPSSLASSDIYGTGVALSADGATALVGAPDAECAAGDNCGAAYVFVRTGTTWTEQARLTASDAGPFHEFGYSVALSADGDVALVGALGTPCGALTFCGAAYVFVRGGGTWTEQARLTPLDPQAGLTFGRDVDLSADGATALVGAYRASCPMGLNCGAAYVFVDSGGVWSQQARLVHALPRPSELFGSSVALSADGGTALVGAPGADCILGPLCGAAFVFVRSGGSWSEQQALAAGDRGAGEQFGFAVDLSSTGDTALIGTPVDCLPGPPCGSAYVFLRSGGTWAQEQKLTSPDPSAAQRFGNAVALDGGGEAALIGAPGDFAINSGGRAYLFTRGGGGWTLLQPLIPLENEPANLFGQAVALSGDATRALAGAPADDCAAGIDCGAAYVFVLDASQILQIPALEGPGLALLALSLAAFGALLLRQK